MRKCPVIDIHNDILLLDTPDECDYSKNLEDSGVWAAPVHNVKDDLDTLPFKRDSKKEEPRTPKTPAKLAQPITPSTQFKTGSSSASSTGGLQGAGTQDETVQVGEVDLATKFCVGCDFGALEPTTVDIAEGSTVRPWALKHHWGTLCLWCTRMMRVRYAWMRKQAVEKWLQQADNKSQFKLRSIAYVSMREEGKVKTTAEAVDERADALLRYGRMATDVMQKDAPFMQAMLVTDFKGDCVVNPIAQQRALVQVVVDGQKRLAFMCPSARPPNRLALPSNVVAGEGLWSQCEEDMQLLKDLSDDAFRQRQSNMNTQASLDNRSGYTRQCSQTFEDTQLSQELFGDSQPRRTRGLRGPHTPPKPPPLATYPLSGSELRTSPAWPMKRLEPPIMY